MKWKPLYYTDYVSDFSFSTDYFFPGEVYKAHILVTTRCAEETETDIYFTYFTLYCNM